MIPYTQVEINRSETTNVTVEVLAWEVPVLVNVNGDDRCRPLGTFGVEREIPRADSEYARLEMKYGVDPDTGKDHVAEVYGVGQQGVKRLGEEIARACKAKLAVKAKVDDPLEGLFDPPDESLSGAEAIGE